MLGIKRLGRLTGTIAMLTAMAWPALGQASSDKPISIVVPYAAGGTTDNFTRMLAEGMSRELNRTVIVENKPGANGIIASTHVARAPADGTTLLLGGTGPVALNIMLRPELAYDFDSFDSVAMLFDGPLTITVPTRLGVDSIEGLVKYSKTNHQPIRVGTLGPGSVSDLYALIFAKTLDVEVLPVPYKSTPMSLIDLLGGQGEMTNATPIALLEHQKAGNLKILALTTEERDPTFPDIPTVTELGYPELKSSYWAALHAPKGTPPEVIKELADAAIKVVQSKEIHDTLVRTGQRARAGGPEVLDAQLAHDREHWGALIKANNIVLK